MLISLITPLRAEDSLIPISAEELKFPLELASERSYPQQDRGLGAFTKCEDDFPPSVLLWLLIPWLLALPCPRPARAWPLLTAALLVTMAAFDAYAQHRDPAAVTWFFR
ncbi:MAG: hypothetical protein RL095_4067 [Verrucomicrobiota bacterium]